MASAIEFENISKQYRLGLVSTGTLSHDLNRFWQTKILRREDPYLKVGETNDRASKGSSDYVWALKDINFKVEQGDVVGIIGRNGAGKSTLLKLLSRVTAPTTGIIRAKGRIASLLEVGTGFHPEMTGRENIYMNGAIMGMTRAEISRKLDEIVDFSGCERYLDTPVKRYSSGMTVRLGFAIAAHLDPEILVVDEVLAVGDAEFQKKAIGKMQDVSKGEGRTVLFVSHNMGAVKNLCKTGILLKNGIIELSGEIGEVVDKYSSANINCLTNELYVTNKHHVAGVEKEFEYTYIKMLNDVNNVSNQEPLEFEVSFNCNQTHVRECQFGITIQNESNERVGGLYTQSISIPQKAKKIYAKITIPHHQLCVGKYSLNFNISQYSKSSAVKNYDFIPQALSFEVKYWDKNHNVPIIYWPKIGNISFKDTSVDIIKVD